MMAIVWMLNEDELLRIVNKNELRNLVLLVFLNKQDLSNAMSAEEMTDKLDLHSLCEQWLILVHRATMGDRL
uniref:ADP-ribosylation factor n=1 Tax=Peronospora matthiolae TaxID=2874970 RepID=A0AAV1TDQ6_9STRA